MSSNGNSNNPTVPHSLYTAANVTPCTCAFLTWGQWSSDANHNKGNNAGGNNQGNLATYVTGTLTSTVQLPNTGTATYVGDMSGSVRNGGNSYLAVGG